MSGLINHVIPPQCYHKFVHEHNFEADCLKIVISKVLGYMVIMASVMVKVPQIMKILKAGSAEGISVVAVVLELMACTSAFAYNFGNNFPFSAYGELSFIIIQQVIIFFLLLFFTRGATSALIWSAVYSAIFSFLLSPRVPKELLATMQASVIILVVVSRLSQASMNFTNKSTGQLSLITVLLQFIGTAVRILTSLQETGDKISILSYSVSTFMTGIILFQVFLYWDSNSRTTGSSSEDLEEVKKIN